MAPLVSIVIDNYNYGRYLGPAIDSALAQTHPAVEVIVVDDGSTDDSRAVVARYGARLTPVFQPNGGQAAALSAGFARSRGELVIFLDADDVLLPEAAALAAAAWAAQPEAAKIQYRMRVIDAAGRPTGEIKPAPNLPLLQGDLRRHAVSFPFDLVWMATSGNAFPRRVLAEIMPIPEQDFRILADYYLVHLAALYGPVLFLAEFGAHYRVHGGNNHQAAPAALNLAQLRQTLVYAERAQAHLRRRARELGLARADDPVQSVSQVAGRLASLRLEPAAHVFPDDTVLKLWALGCRTAARRFDVALPMRLMFAIWFTAMAGLPAAGARWLAELFFVPEKRRSLNPLLGRLHRGPAR